MVPIATDDVLGTKKFGVGPTAVAVKQIGQWTIGALVNQLWSVAGDEARGDVSQFFGQPFVVYNWKSGAGVGANAEITRNWKAETTVVFLTPTVSAVTRLGKQSVSLTIGPRFCLAAPENAKADWGWRVALVFVFPK